MSKKKSKDHGLFTEQQRQVQGGVDFDHLCEIFNADPEVWVPKNVSATFWEQPTKDEPQVLGSLRASFERSPIREARIAEQILAEVVKDMRKHVPAYDVRGFKTRMKRLDPFCEQQVAYVMHQNDAHIGNLAWRKETGKDDYDINIAIRDYEAMTDKLMAVSLHYNVDETIVVLGHDFQHVDYVFNKVGQTTKGTQQDYDSRLPKIITAVRRLAVRQIDLALGRGGKVTVVVVPGNHDRIAMYNLIETLYAWYRKVPEVTILNAPVDGAYQFARLRQYHQYAENGFMFAHGENFRRNQEPLPLIFADEAPDVWAASKYREVLCGHWHKTESKGYRRPVPDLSETRGVRMRALPGLTAVDAWHDDNSYSHWRAATGIAYKASGGVAGLHEVEP